MNAFRRNLGIASYECYSGKRNLARSPLCFALRAHMRSLVRSLVTTLFGNLSSPKVYGPLAAYVSPQKVTYT